MNMILEIDDQIENPDIIILALERHNLTQYDFYQSFADYYHNLQIQKLRDQGKQINYESFWQDLNQYSMNLAIEMTKNQLTQVQYKFSGQLQLTSRQYKQQQKWEDEFFNDFSQNGEYKKLIRSAVILGQKGSLYFFVHKSIQEFFIAKCIYEILEQSHSLNLSLLKLCLELGQQLHNKLIVQFTDFLESNKVMIISEIKHLSEDQYQTVKLQKELTDIIEYLKQLQFDYINQVNLSKEEFQGSIKFLKEKINLDNQTKQMMLCTSKLSGIDPKYVKLSSNFFYLLTNMFEYLGEQDFRHVILEDTSVAGGLFHGSDFSGSVFKNVNISGINLNRAILANVDWNNLRINELPLSYGHNDQITCIDFSPDGTQFVSSSMDLIIKLWDANSGQIIKNFIGHSDWVLSVAFSPNSSYIVSCGCDKSIIIWSVGTVSVYKKFSGGLLTIKKAVFSPDGLNILSGGDEKFLKLWQINPEQVKMVYQGHKQTINSFCFSKHGLYIVSCSQDSQIIVWDTLSGESIIAIESQAFSVCFSPDEKRIVSGGSNQIIYVWDAKTGKLLSQISGHQNTVLSVTYSKDGTRIASGSSDKSIRVWDSSTTKELQRLEGHQEFVNQVIFSPNGQKLVSCSKDKTMRQWDITAEGQTIKMEGHSGVINSLQFTPDGQNIVSGCFSDSIGCWDADNGKSLNKIKDSKNEAKIALSYDGRFLASKSNTNIIIRNQKNGEIPNIVYKNEGFPTSIVFSPDSKRIASCDITKSITEWNMLTQEEIHKKQCAEIPYSIAYNNQGNCLAIAQKLGFVELWTIEMNQSEIFEIPESYKLKDKLIIYDAIAVAFSPDDQNIIVGYQSASMLLWNIIDKTHQIINVHTQAVNSVAFSKDGQFIFSASNDYTISIVETCSLQLISKLEGHQSEINSLALSVDGQRFAAGGWDKIISLWQYSKSPVSIGDQTFDWPVYCSNEILISAGQDSKVRLWNLTRGQEIMKFGGHSSKIIAVTISKDNQKIAASSKSSIIIIWNVNNGEEIWKHEENQPKFNTLLSFSNNGLNLVVGGIGNFIRVYDISQKIQVYSNQVQPLHYLELLTYFKEEWQIKQNDTISIFNLKTGKSIELPQEPASQSKLQGNKILILVSCYKIISQYLTSLKSKDAYIYNSKIKSQLGFDIQILLKQKGGHIQQTE